MIEKYWKHITLAAALLLGIVLAVNSLPSIHSRLGRADFLGYWSASYLLSQGENFSDDELMMQTQTEIINWDRGFPIKSWNPPWLLAWLLPFTTVGFDNGATLWLAANFLLIFFSAVLLWKAYAPPAVSRRWFWLPILAVFLFPFTATALVVGQVNTLVLTGLVVFLYLYQRSYDLGAGIGLSLTMVKPQLVYIVIPLIMLSTIKNRRWKVILGFVCFLLLSTLIVGLFRPSFIGEYAGSFSNGGLLSYRSPTSSVVLSELLNLSWFRLAGALIVPIAIWLWIRYENVIDMNLLVDLSLMASIITAPFLWSYDYIVLLIPLTRIWVWMIEGVISQVATTIVAIAMVVLYIFLYYMRIESPHEIYYSWFPILVASLYLWLWYKKKLTMEEAPAAEPTLEGI